MVKDLENLVHLIRRGTSSTKIVDYSIPRYSIARSENIKTFFWRHHGRVQEQGLSDSCLSSVDAIYWALRQIYTKRYHREYMMMVALTSFYFGFFYKEEKFKNKK